MKEDGAKQLNPVIDKNGESNIESPASSQSSEGIGAPPEAKRPRGRPKRRTRSSPDESDEGASAKDVEEGSEPTNKSPTDNQSLGSPPTTSPPVETKKRPGRPKKSGIITNPDSILAQRLLRSRSSSVNTDTKTVNSAIDIPSENDVKPTASESTSPLRNSINGECEDLKSNIKTEITEFDDVRDSEKSTKNETSDSEISTKNETSDKGSEVTRSVAIKNEKEEEKEEPVPVLDLCLDGDSDVEGDKRDIGIQTAFICSDHFSADDYHGSKENWVASMSSARLRYYAVPHKKTCFSTSRNAVQQESSIIPNTNAAFNLGILGEITNYNVLKAAPTRSCVEVNASNGTPMANEDANKHTLRGILFACPFCPAHFLKRDHLQMHLSHRGNTWSTAHHGFAITSMSVAEQVPAPFQQPVMQPERIPTAANVPNIIRLPLQYSTTHPGNVRLVPLGPGESGMRFLLPKTASPTGQPLILISKPTTPANSNVPLTQPPSLVQVPPMRHQAPPWRSPGPPPLLLQSPVSSSQPPVNKAVVKSLPAPKPVAKRKAQARSTADSEESDSDSASTITSSENDNSSDDDEIEEKDEHEEDEESVDEDSGDDSDSSGQAKKPKRSRMKDPLYKPPINVRTRRSARPTRSKGPMSEVALPPITTTKNVRTYAAANIASISNAEENHQQTEEAEEQESLFTGRHFLDFDDHAETFNDHETDVPPSDVPVDSVAHPVVEVDNNEPVIEKEISNFPFEEQMERIASLPADVAEKLIEAGAKQTNRLLKYLEVPSAELKTQRRKYLTFLRQTKWEGQFLKDKCATAKMINLGIRKINLLRRSREHFHVNGAEKVEWTPTIGPVTSVKGPESSEWEPRLLEVRTLNPALV